MAGALVYLRVTSLLGRIRSRLVRLKQPKYLAGSIVGAAYIYFSFVRRLQVHNIRRPHPGRVDIPLESFATLLPELGALMLLIILLVNWAIPRGASLVFSESEIAFLFPAPVTRRMLLHYRLLGSQLGIALTALLFTLVFGRGQSIGGTVWIHVTGWWLILATLNLHLTGISFVQSKLMNRSITSARHRSMVLALVGVAVAALLVWAWGTMRAPQGSDFGTTNEFISYVSSQLHTGPLTWLLAIPKLVIAPYLATDGRALLLALGPALLVLIAHYFWVMHVEVSFEEASIARAEKRAARLRKIQQGDWRGESSSKARRPPFELPGDGRPETAFLWKNLLSTGAFFRPRAALITLIIVFVGCEWLVRLPSPAPARLIAQILTGFVVGGTLLLGPLIARQDLRADLLNADILKTYPLRGWQVVAGELLTPLSILSVIFWLGLFAGYLLVPVNTWSWLDPSLRAGAAIGLGLIAPPFIAIQLLVLNTAAVLFPAWIQSAANRTERGIEVVGQRLIFVAGQLLVTAIAVLPAALSAAFVFLVAQWLAGAVIAAVLAVVVVVLLLGVEAWLGLLWLGRRFELFDLSAELRP